MRHNDIARLWGLAAARCSNPDCRLLLAPDFPRSGRLNIGDMAHVIARSPRGPRGQARCPGDNRYENLILLCPTDHRQADRAPADFPAAKLRRWKRLHERWVEQRLLDVPRIPVVWRIRHLPNELLAGRGRTLTSIARALDGRPVQVLYGMPGVGKSQIAAHLAAERSARYSVVVWLRAHDLTTFGDDLRTFADDLRLDVPDADDEQVTSAVKAWLDANERWLVIFDGIEDPDLLRVLLPPDPAGHAVVTTLDAAWRGPGQRRRIRPLPAETGARYLLTATGLSERAAARALAGELGGLPLALEQCAAYVAASGAAERVVAVRRWPPPLTPGDAAPRRFRHARPLCDCRAEGSAEQPEYRHGDSN